MDKPPEVPVVSADGRQFAIYALGLAATLAACAFALVSAIRVINSPDIGYHLAYGEYFLQTGKIVQSNRWVWYPLDNRRLSNPDELGPGCTYDPVTHTYGFVNANWGTQVVVAAAYRAGGMTALVLVEAAVWGAILVLVIVTMRRNGVAWHWVGLPVILIFLASDQRIPLRPEVFGFLFMAGQWTLLAGPGFGPKRAIGVVLLQVLAANFHSYFLLGIGLSGAMALDAWLQRLSCPQQGQPAAEAARRWKWLAIATAGTVAASFCNPWFARGAIMPIETLLYLYDHHIGDAQWRGQTHPWSLIPEFSPPLSLPAWGGRMGMTLVVITVPAVLAMVPAILRRRWGWALVILVMLTTGYQMHRNIAPTAIIIAPLTAIVLLPWAGEKLAQQFQLMSQARGRKEDLPPAEQAPPQTVAVLVAIGTFLLGAWLTQSVVTNRYFTRDGRPASFGLGASHLLLPLDAAEWINAHQPPGRIFSNYGSTSNLMFFTRPHRDMPELTNTWAMPPYVQWQCAEIELADRMPPKRRRNFDAFAEANDVQTVAIGFHGGQIPLIHFLANDPNWAIVCLGASDIVFIRKNGAAGELAQQAITAENFDVADYIRRIETIDAAPGRSLANAAGLLRAIGWTEQAAAVMRHAVQLDPDMADLYSVRRE